MKRANGQKHGSNKLTSWCIQKPKKESIYNEMNREFWDNWPAWLWVLMSPWNSLSAAFGNVPEKKPKKVIKKVSQRTFVLRMQHICDAPESCLSLVKWLRFSIGICSHLITWISHHCIIYFIYYKENKQDCRDVIPREKKRSKLTYCA